MHFCSLFLTSTALNTAGASLKIEFHSVGFQCKPASQISCLAFIMPAGWEKSSEFACTYDKASLSNITDVTYSVRSYKK